MSCPWSSVRAWGQEELGLLLEPGLGHGASVVLECQAEEGSYLPEPQSERGAGRKVQLRAPCLNPGICFFPVACGWIAASREAPACSPRAMPLALGITDWALPPRRVILILEHHAAFN